MDDPSPHAAATGDAALAPLARLLQPAARPLLRPDPRGFASVLTDPASGSGGRFTARKIAAGTAAMAKRSAPSSSGANASSPARMPGKADAQPSTVRVTATAAPVSRRPFVRSVIAMVLIGSVPWFRRRDLPPAALEDTPVSCC